MVWNSIYKKAINIINLILGSIRYIFCSSLLNYAKATLGMQHLFNVVNSVGERTSLVYEALAK